MPNPQWTILAVLRWATDYFREKGVSEPRASAEVLLAHALSLSRLDLYLRHDQPLSPEELARFKALVIRRRQGEPVAYLTGFREFWSLSFRVTPAVLIPRPETEILVEAVLEVFPRKTENGKRKTVNNWGLEVGTGCGAVAIVLARELPELRWVAVDLSRDALEVARDNARRLEADAAIRFLQADILTALKPGPRLALIAANLPYVPRRVWERLPADIREFEPKTAFLAGEEGLDVLRRLIAEAHQYLLAGGWLTLEVGDGQAEAVRQLLLDTAAYDRVDLLRDYQGVQRVVRGRRSGSD